MVVSGLPDNNYGSSVSNAVGYNPDASLPGFVWSFVRPNSFAVSGTITDATFDLHVNHCNGNGMTIGVYPALSFWSEGTITWTYKPDAGNWQDNNTYSGGCSSGLSTFHVTTLAQEWNSGATNQNGVVFAWSDGFGVDSGDSVTFDTTEFGTAPMFFVLYIPLEPPTVTANSATSIGQTSATLNAVVNPNGFETTVYFDYGTSPSFGQTVTFGSVGSGSSPVLASTVLGSLTPNTMYYFRARASNSGGTTNGSTQTFTTTGASGDIFADGFETGDTTNWSQTVGTSTAQNDGTGELTLTGGTLAGQALSPSIWEITVSAGSQITGNVTFDTDNFMGAGAVAPLGYTWTWSDRTVAIASIHGDIPTGTSNWDVPIDLTTPAIPGTYYLLFAFNGEFNMSQVLSCDSWAASGGVIWNDGNDYHDMTASHINFAQANGFVDTWTYRSASGYLPTDVPMMPVKIVVTGSVQLEGHYPFEGNANDASGNGYHGTPSGVTWPTGHTGRCAGRL